VKSQQQKPYDSSVYHTQRTLGLKVTLFNQTEKSNPVKPGTDPRGRTQRDPPLFLEGKKF